jgi:hypothetical protein
LFERNRTASLSIDAGEQQVVHTAAALLRRDVQAVFGATLRLASGSEPVDIVAGTVGVSSGISRMVAGGQVDVSAIAGKWEAFLLATVEAGGRRTLVIAGSDSRGTAYGLLELSRLIGVSPWHYFADATPAQAERYDFPSVRLQQSPSVRYRGVFINDEDWGWMPWATQTLTQSAKGAVGAEAYEKLFELLLRLRANTLWPAMHECTVPFYFVEGNKEMADKYGMVVGTSHCEPLMRSSASEWDAAGKGDYNYVTNREEVLSYWADRLKELQGSDNIFTIGMRGKHDGMMQGVRTLEEHKLQLSRIIPDQQELLRRYVNPDPSKVAQAFIPYKEVLDVYDAGLEVPDYVTLVWCDDNYGYIRRLSNERERLRQGGAGVYYHVSYWGRPHDYLWLASTSPALMHTEMKRAYEHGADRLWILNVGDVKPAEYLTEFFMDMAWNIHLCDNKSVFSHLEAWTAREFGASNAERITSVMKTYYRLANVRKPEHIGWSRVEEGGYPRGLTPVKDTEFSPALNGELPRRLQAYADIEATVKQVSATMAASKRSAFFQMVEYPVRGASLMNQKWLNAQMSRRYAGSDKDKAQEYAAKSLAAYEEIRQITDEYSRMENGKWAHIMDFQPRNLPVFAKPQLPALDSLFAGHEVKEQNPAAKPAAGGVVALQAWQATNGTSRQRIEGLGHSFAAVPVKQDDSLIFELTVPAAGEGSIRVAAIPNHDVDGQGMKIAVTVDGALLPVADYSVEGRSETWKNNVLRGQAVATFKCRFNKAGRTVVSVKALTPYVILDQIMLVAGDADNFYEFPTSVEK